LASSRAYYWKNREYYLEKHKEWRTSNPEHARANVNARRKRVQQATPPWMDKSLFVPLYKEAQLRGLEVDHVIPINHPLVCGLHVPWNLQLLTHDENLRKGNRFDESRSNGGPITAS
jgi:hypothetical protein